MNQIRSRINALRRKMALEISVVRLRPLADDFCLQWSVAVSDRKPPPDDQTFIRRVADAGFRLPTFMAAHRYLTRCLAENVVPRRRASPGRPSPLGRSPRSCCSFRRPPSHAQPPKRLKRAIRRRGPGNTA